MPETKQCESCDAVIGSTEAKCPKCGIDFEELEEAVTTVTKAQAVIDKRKKAAEPKPCEKCGKVHEGACAPQKKKSVFRSLGSALRKKG